jgi:hypothetical protein
MNAHNLPIAALGLILATAAAADDRPATSPTAHPAAAFVERSRAGQPGSERGAAR